MSDRRKKLREKRKAAKEARMKPPKSRGESKYALKKRGTYPRNSPYLTGNWGQRMAGLWNERFFAQFGEVSA
jgi:hypothetical protein